MQLLIANYIFFPWNNFYLKHFFVQLIFFETIQCPDLFVTPCILNSNWNIIMRSWNDRSVMIENSIGDLFRPQIITHIIKLLAIVAADHKYYVNADILFEILLAKVLRKKFQNIALRQEFVVKEISYYYLQLNIFNL